MKANQQWKTLDWVYPFGNYRGHSLEDVIELDPHYVRWCIDNISGFRLDATARGELEISEENMADLVGPMDPLERDTDTIPESEE